MNGNLEIPTEETLEEAEKLKESANALFKSMFSLLFFYSAYYIVIRKHLWYLKN